MITLPCGCQVSRGKGQVMLWLLRHRFGWAGWIRWFDRLHGMRKCGP